MLLQSAVLVWQLVFSPVAVPRVVSDLDLILSKWCAASRRIELFDAEFSQYDYDLTFQVERRSTGRIFFRAPGQMRFESRPAPITPEMRSRRLSASGDAFQLKPGDFSLWIENDAEILFSDEIRKSYWRYRLNAKVGPNGAPVTNVSIWNNWLIPHPILYTPLLVDLKEEQLRRDCKFEVAKSDVDTIRLIGTPLTSALRTNISSMAIILERQTFLPKAVKYVASTGNDERVFVFDRPKIRQSIIWPWLERWINQIQWKLLGRFKSEHELLHPDLNAMGYRDQTATTSK